MNRRAVFVPALAVVIAAIAPCGIAQTPTETTGDFKTVPPVTPEAPGVRPGERHRPLTYRVAQQVLPLFNALETGEGYKGELAIIGDSISFSSDQYVWFLKRRFIDDYGYGGDGFHSPSGLDGGCDGQAYLPCGITMTNTQGAGRGNNTGPRSPETFGVDVDGNMAFVTLSENNVHGRLFAQLYGDTITVHYIKEFGAGQFDVLLNGSFYERADAFTEGAPKHGSITVHTGVASSDQLSHITIKHVSGGRVRVDGLEMQHGDSGFVQHRLARGGVGPDDFLRGVGDASEGFLAELNPQLAIVMIDWVGEPGHMTYVDDMNLLLSFYEQAMPDTRFILMTHHPFNQTLEDQADILYAMARSRGHGYINLYDLFDGFDEMDSLGFMEDEVHMLPAGGEWFGDYIYELLRAAAVLGRSVDFNADEAIDVRDLAAFLGAFSAGDARCDIDADGTESFGDVLAFLRAYRDATR